MIVVTGGAGFIGTNLVRSLLESDKKVLVVEELDKYTKKFENINNLNIEDCVDNNHSVSYTHLTLPTTLLV